eukprot:c4586_g1_i1.p1 GENE.c4586_g1_i1~~c4586_g1_i1.p1  ORF type:complete len:156 (-),score=16.66 c4586_g1_i1:66-533(-)
MKIKASLDVRRCAINLFPCQYPGCSEAFTTKTSQRIHRLSAHPARQTTRDLANMARYIRRFHMTASGGKPFGQGPTASHLTMWCGAAAGSSADALARPSVAPMCFSCPHPRCTYAACSSSDLIEHNYAMHYDMSKCPSPPPFASAFTSEQAITVV